MSIIEIIKLTFIIATYISITLIATIIFSYIFWFLLFVIAKHNSIDFTNCNNVDECYIYLNNIFWKFVNSTFYNDIYDEKNKPKYIVLIPIMNIVIICIIVICFIIIKTYIIFKFFIIKILKIKYIINYIYNTSKNINKMFHNKLKNIKLKNRRK